MEHIENFNREIAELVMMNPHWEGMQAVEQYRQSLRAGMDYHGALTLLGSQLGLELSTKEILFKNGKSKGHIPVINLREGNPYDGKKGVRKINEWPYNSLPKLYGYMARQYVYFLIDAKVFKEHALGATAH